jgi:hypothetical protein
MLNINSDKFKFGVTIYLNPKNSLTFSVSGNPSRKTDGDKTISQYFDRQKNLTDNVFTLNSEKEREKSPDYIAGYRKTFDRKGEELTLDYIFTNNNTNVL